MCTGQETEKTAGKSGSGKMEAGRGGHGKTSHGGKRVIAEKGRIGVQESLRKHNLWLIQGEAEAAPHTGKTWPTKKPGRARPAEAECNGPKQVQKAGRQERKKGKGRGCQAGSLPSWCQLAVPTAAAAANAAMAGPPMAGPAMAGPAMGVYVGTPTPTRLVQNHMIFF